MEAEEGAKSKMSYGLMSGTMNETKENERKSPG